MPTQADMIVRRLAALHRELVRRRIGAMLVTDPINVSYLSGFTGDDSWLLVDGRRPCLLTDFRYEGQAADECPWLRRVVRRAAMVDALAKVVRRRHLKSVAFDPDTVSVAVRSRLGKALKRVRLAPMPGTIANLRMHKDATEVAAIRRAIAVAEAAFAEFRRRIRPGMTERRLAGELEYQMRLAGADGLAFPTICAVDASAAMPHARPGGKRLKRDSLLLVDFGARVGGYVCDLTRVLLAGRIRPHVRSAYTLVQEAQAAAIAKVGPAVPLVEADAAARHVIEKAGFGKAFRHGLGHGLGRQVHEPPGLAPRGVKGCLEPGMVVTIEPGVYFKGRFGIRIEDDVLVTATGRRVLTHLEKDIEAMVL